MGCALAAKPLCALIILYGVSSMNKKSATLFMFPILFGLSFTNTFGQLISEYGLKSGFTSAWQTEIIFGDKLKGIDNKSGLVFGFYAEIFKSQWYSINTELNYSQKGMQTEIPFTNEQYPDGTGEFIKSNLRLNYLSVLILPHIYKNIQSLKFYAFAGPRFDIEISKNNNVSGPEPTRTFYSDGVEKQLNNYKSFQFGLSLGLGLQVKELLPFCFGIEARYNPDLSKVYETEYLYIKNNSMDLLLTIAI